MEFSSIWYLSFWSLVSVLFSTTGICALRKATLPVSDVIMFHVELFIYSSATFLSFYGFLFRPALEHDQDLNPAHRYNILSDFYVDFGCIISVVIYFQAAFPAYFAILEHKWIGTHSLVAILLIPPIFARGIRKRFKCYQAIGNLLTAFAGPLIMYPYHTLCFVLCQGFSQLLVHYRLRGLWKLHFQSIFLPIYCSNSFLTSFNYLKKLITTSIMGAPAYKHQRINEIVSGILVTTLAQYYFRVKSMSLMLGLTSLTFAWLGVLANVQPQTDFGIFHFLVTASLECIVSLFGLNFYTFIAVCGGIVLMVLRWKMEFVSLRHSGRQEIVARYWKILETHNLEQPSEDVSNTQRLGIQRRITQQFGRQGVPYARRFGA